MRDDLIKKFIGHCKRNGIIRKSGSLLVAFSGGADSTALLELLIRLKDRWDLRIGAAHVNHLLRGKDSEGDAEFCHEFALRHAIPFYCREADVMSYASRSSYSIEQAARILRYRILSELAAENGYPFIATAHTADDNAETFLMHLLRGGDWESLQGIPEKRDNILRPLLWCAKSEIYAYLTFRNVEWREDLSNRENAFLRNKIRNILLPVIGRDVNPDIRTTLNRWSALFRDLRDYAGRIAEEVFPSCYRSLDDGTLIIDRKRIREFPAFMQKSILKRIFSGSGIFPSAAQMDAITSNANAEMQSGKVLSLPKGYTLRIDRDILIANRPMLRNFNFPVTVGMEHSFLEGAIAFRSGIIDEKHDRSEWDEIIDARCLEGKPLILRNWLPGDRFHPFGGSGEKKLSDYFIDKKVPAGNKGRIPILVAGGDIIWVCGYRLSEKARVDAETNLRCGLKCTYRRDW